MSRIRKHKIGKDTSTKRKRRKLRKETVWTMIFAGVLFISVVGMMFGGVSHNPDDYVYKQQKFTRTNQGWMTNVDGASLRFDFFPGDIEQINISSDVFETLKSKKVIWLTFNPATKDLQTMELTRFELGNLFSTHLGTYISGGITQDNLDYSLPIINCINATPEIPVILLETANQSSVEKIGDCIQIKGTSNGIIAIKDRIAYQMLGIME
ncbi:hypothetical protein HN587_06915 [Candidatus Woesearchaeota archaeon]|jgi:hypothetical protein|nr:hypothetical protein [Candidatus Woesearchaeota archaeon]